ncbi:FixH family protein [Larkinella bovis]|uniref:FixH family protein n=1 Tax=Larkinella bovis TaxID=683041 RepID=A0ABW0I6V6_9BACT
MSDELGSATAQKWQRQPQKRPITTCNSSRITSKTMNWGKSIIAVFIVFAGFIGSLVFLMSRQQVDLVRDDYYQTEVAYQQHIDRISRTARLGQPVEFTYQPDRQQIHFLLPDGFQRGEIKFYRPSDRQLDSFVRIESGPGRQWLSTANLAKGNWRIQFTWSDGRQDYFVEKPLAIQ